MPADRIRDRFLREFPSAIVDDQAAIFAGAGVSMAAGYPSWKDLLIDIGEELGVKSSDISDLAALAQWSITERGGATGIREIVRAQLGVRKDTPQAVEILVRMPFRHLWTTNYDRLLERAFDEIRRPYDVISSSEDLTIRPRPGAARIYKMHGTVDNLSDIVISTNDYELYRSKRGGFLPLLQAHMSTMSMLFLGLSFTDPNLRHVLSIIRENFTDAPPHHFAIVRPPQEDDFISKDEYKAKLTQHNLWAKDLRRYGLFAVEIDSYGEVPHLLRELEQRVARRRVWVSGSWPLDVPTKPSVTAIHQFSEKIGRLIGDLGLTLVNGSGLIVGSACVSGFFSSLREEGGWDLERRLLVRPFPQALSGKEPDRAHWQLLREEMARLAGIVLFVGGLKSDGTSVAEADGVHAERELAEKLGSFLLPIGSTGGAAESIARSLLGSRLDAEGSAAQRPTDDQLLALLDPNKSEHEHLEIIKKILEKIALR